MVFCMLKEKQWCKIPTSELEKVRIYVDDTIFSRGMVVVCFLISIVRGRFYQNHQPSGPDCHFW